MADYTLTQGDVKPRLELQLLNADGTAPDLRKATLVKCRVQHSDRSRQASVTDAIVVNAQAGYVAHEWTADETSRPGLLSVQFERTDAGYQQAWPPRGPVVVLVNPRLAPPA